MKLNFIATGTMNRKYDSWLFHFLPVLFLWRDDKCDDEKAYYFGNAWTIVQMYVIIRLPKKREEETQYVGPASDCQQ